MNKQITTKNFTIGLWPDGGFFEHNDHGDEYGGGLWFNGKELVDYDGVYELPGEVVRALDGAGYDMSYVNAVE